MADELYEAYEQWLKLEVDHYRSVGIGQYCASYGFVHQVYPSKTRFPGGVLVKFPNQRGGYVYKEFVGKVFASEAEGHAWEEAQGLKPFRRDHPEMPPGSTSPFMYRDPSNPDKLWSWLYGPAFYPYIVGCRGRIIKTSTTGNYLSIEEPNKVVFPRNQAPGNAWKGQHLIITGGDGFTLGDYLIKQAGGKRIESTRNYCWAVLDRPVGEVGADKGRGYIADYVALKNLTQLPNNLEEHLRATMVDGH